MIQDQEYIFKIVIVGDQCVGKTSIFKRLADQQLPSFYVPTIGVDFTIKTIPIENKIAKLQIWDTSGQERFMNITTSYIRGADGILVVYDITDDESFSNIKYWLHTLKQQGLRDGEIIVFGNKADSEEKRKVATDEAKQYCQNNNLRFYEISAKTSQDQINQAISELSVHLIAKKELLQEKQRLDSLQQQQDQDETQKDQNGTLKEDLASLRVEVQGLKQQIKNITYEYKSEIQQLKQKIQELENDLQKK